MNLLTEIVGNRIYAHRAPELATLPYVVYSMPSNVHSYDLDGANGVSAASVQFNIFASSQEEMLNIAAALQIYLHGEKGMFGATKVLSCRLEAHQDTSQQANDSDDWTFSKMMRFVVLYIESNPLFAGSLSSSSESIDKSIVAHLSDIAPVYVSHLPQSVNREIVNIIYSRLNESEPLDLDGVIPISLPIFEFTIRGKSFLDVVRVADLIRQRLSGFRGQLENTGVLSIELANEVSSHSPITAQDRGFFYITQTWKFIHGD